MTRNLKPYRILALTPSSRGFGYAILDGESTLADWGVKSVKGDKNIRALAKVEEMIAHDQPDIIVMEDPNAKGSRRSERIRSFSHDIAALASTKKVPVVLFSQVQVKQTFFEDGEGTKHTIAVVLSKRFAGELDFRLPPKRKPWMSEDYRMDIFYAVALAVVFRLRKGRRSA